MCLSNLLMLLQPHHLYLITEDRAIRSTHCQMGSEVALPLLRLVSTAISNCQIVSEAIWCCLVPDLRSRGFWQAATVKKFNQMAENGLDDEFGRGGTPHERQWQFRKTEYPNPCMHPLATDGPLYALVIGPQVRKTYLWLLAPNDVLTITVAGH